MEGMGGHGMRIALSPFYENDFVVCGGDYSSGGLLIRQVIKNGRRLNVLRAHIVSYEPVLRVAIVVCLSSLACTRPGNILHGG